MADPSGKKEYEISISASLVFGGGGEVEAGVKFDTSSLQLSGFVGGSLRAGFDAGANIGLDRSDSNNSVAQNNVSGEYGVDAKASVLVVTGKLDFLTVKQDEGRTRMSGILVPSRSKGSSGSDHLQPSFTISTAIWSGMVAQFVPLMSRTG